MPLRRLRLENCTNNIDLIPLLDCRQLEALVFQGPATNVAALRGHSSLRQLTNRNFVEFGGDFTAVPPASEFWAAEDAKVVGAK